MHRGSGSAIGACIRVIAAFLTYAKEIMSKRIGMRVALAITALGAMTLLQGCEDEEGFGIGTAWAPIGSAPLPGFFSTFTGSTGGTTQTTTGTATGGGTQ